MKLKYVNHCKTVYPYLVTKQKITKLLLQVLKDTFKFSPVSKEAASLLSIAEESKETEEELEFEEVQRQFSLWKDQLNKKVDLEIEEKSMGDTDRMMKYTLDLKYLKP